MNGKRALVIFGEEVPRNMRGFDSVVASKKLQATIEGKGLGYVDLETLVDQENIRDATSLLVELSRVQINGARVAKSVVYHGYELWWTHYDALMYRVCLPYTQYRRLLNYLKDFSSISVYRPPAEALFRSFFEAHGSEYVFYKGQKNLPSLGTWFQVFLTLVFLPWLMLRRARLLMWTSDRFDPPRDHDFRMRLAYEELRKRKIPFVECIRSLEPIRTVFSHALERRRPVVYSYAIYVVISWIVGLFSIRTKNTRRATGSDPKEEFIQRLASYYIPNTRGVVWSVRVMRVLFWMIGVRVAFILAAFSRNFSEVLACKTSGIPTVGILHGLTSKYYNSYEFMPEFDGEKSLSLDEYGVWSEWLRDYYIQNGKTYRPEQLYVSGLMRPLQKRITALEASPHLVSEPLKVLFVAEEVAAPAETLPYLLALLEAKDLSLYIKFRSYRDRFEDWLKEYRPDILERMNKHVVLRGDMSEAIAQCDVVVGSYSTAVLEALLQLKPPIFFQSKKWGDYFELKSFNAGHQFIAETPDAFLNLVQKSGEISQDTLRAVQERFFGDPYRNGNVWLVDRLEEKLRATKS